MRTQVVLRQGIVALDFVTDLWTATSIWMPFMSEKPRAVQWHACTNSSITSRGVQCRQRNLGAESYSGNHHQPIQNESSLHYRDRH